MTDMNVILLENDPKLGKRGEVVKVSPGFAQNFLFPYRKAQPATPENLKDLEKQKARRNQRLAEDKARAEDLARRIGEVTVTIEKNAGEGEKLYGAVTSQDIQQALSAKGISVQKRDIHLAEPLKKPGRYEVDVKLHAGVAARVRLEIVGRK